MDVNPMRSKSPPWLWIASIWFAVGLFDATQNVVVMRSEGMHHAWPQLFVTLLVSWLPWILATPFVMRLGRRYPPVQLRPFSTWVRHLAACATIGLVAAAWIASLEELLNPWAKQPAPDPFGNLWLHKFYNGLLEYLFLYGAILLSATSWIPESGWPFNKPRGHVSTSSSRRRNSTLYGDKSSPTFSSIHSMPLLGWCAREETMLRSA